jgi:hypothetical protein
MMLADEFQSADELNAYLDSLVQGGALQSASVDAAVVESARRFHRLGAVAKPEQKFVLGLEKKLMDSTLSVATQRMGIVPPTMPNANGHLRLPNEVATDAIKSNRLKSILLAAVTAVCIASAIAFGAYRLMPPGPPESDEIPAPVVVVQSSPESVDPDFAECTVTPRTADQAALRGTPAVAAILEATTMVESPWQEGVVVPAMPEQHLPQGEEASAEVKTEIEATILEMVACRNAGDWERMDALYSDASFLRVYGHLDGPLSAATPEPPPAPIAVPAALDMRVLPDGHVGVLLSHDLGGYGLRQFLIFVEVDDRWLVDEVVTVKRNYESEGLTPNFHVILAGDLFYEPNRLVVPEKPEAYLQLENVGEVPHSFVFEELDIEIYLSPGETKSILLDVPPGEYEFFSDIPGQRAAGMEGVLVVEPYGIPVADVPEIDCETALVMVATPEVEVDLGTAMVIYAPATTANSTPVAWQEGCD